MKPEQRSTVRDTARYLRNVRPIDPEEVTEYVEGRPHPAAVRQVLREEAFDLGLVERDDGTFVPVDEGPISPAFRGVEVLPERYIRALDDLLVERFGPEWEHGESGDRLRRIVRDLKEDYYRQHPVKYDFDAALGYAIYHLAGYYAAAQYVLDELGRAGLLSARQRTLDVGAGVGGPALGLADYLPGDALVEYHAVEPSEAADVLDDLLAKTGRNFRPEIHRATAESFEPEGEYDLLLFANVLSELDDPVAVVDSTLEHLSDDGALVAIAPADLNTSVGLREVERAIVDREGPYGVFAPTLRLWPGERPTDRGWSFDEKPAIDVPEVQRRLNRGRRARPAERDPATGEFVHASVRYSYSILRRDGRRRYAFTPDASRFAKMAAMEEHVTDRIDCVGIKLSHSLAEGGNPLYKVGDGSESVDHYAVLALETSLNDALRTADYGDLLIFEGTLVLWNDDEGAYNLVVDEETLVDRVPP